MPGTLPAAEDITGWNLLSLSQELTVYTLAFFPKEGAPPPLQGIEVLLEDRSRHCMFSLPGVSTSWKPRQHGKEAPAGHACAQQCPCYCSGWKAEDQGAEKWETKPFNLLAINSFTYIKLKCSAFPSHSSTTVNISVFSALEGSEYKQPITLQWKINCRTLIKQNALEMSFTGSLILLLIRDLARTFFF